MEQKTKKLKQHTKKNKLYHAEEASTSSAIFLIKQNEKST